jgi:ABC-type amino acid transport system permease subunit
MPKDTALAGVMALPELMGLARQAGSPNQRYFEALVVASAWYWLITIILTYFQGKLEHRMSRGDR